MRGARPEIDPARRPLAILAGGGAFPLLVAEAAVRAGRPVAIFAIRGEADPAIEAHRHRWIGRGQLGTLLSGMRRIGARELVIIGGIRARRLPRLSELDFTGIWVVLRNLRILRQGDDGLLRKIAKLIEARGVTIVGAAEVAPELLMPAGPLGRLVPNARDQIDIAAGLPEARRHGAADLGQAVIVVDGVVVAHEGPQGTDAMISAFEAGRGRLEAPSGVLVKCAKPTQDRRLDMPAIGPDTVLQAARAGLAGIAVEQGAALVADRAAVAGVADTRGIFVVGIGDGDPTLAADGEGAP
ncbi:DUF1009 domain-containing protein [Siculibacillus lacustris]|uniref:DUF1009 domain-containing protein n=1 Tax=Siculibacillus lacustris TaxID=1549641 RepID=A0A4Q9VTS2_9HYPH|nr:UDP-2,3-diacylglucosamine diphosphatase LpxI [Siculibacillus lacustris]TBW38490.1 DUF1009 domain-containing protein [Siculibacillus lacustris]